MLIQRLGPESEKSSDVIKALARANASYSNSALSSFLGISKDDNCKPFIYTLGESL